MKVVAPLAVLSACASAFTLPSKAPRGLQSAVGAPAEVDPRRRSVAMQIFGKNAEKEAAEKARIEAEQEALNAQWRKESENELVLMSVFGVGTSLPVIYLLWLALTGDGGGGAGVY